MVKRLLKFAGKASRKARNILFADPKLLYEEERHLKDEPFLFEGTNGKGIVLVHGWTSTPYELRRLGQYLNEKGYAVLGLRLTGHGTRPQDLEGIEWQQWLGDVEKGYEQLKQTCEQVYIGGTSIGGVLALLFAEQQQDVSGLIVMAAPFKMRLEPLALFAAKMLVRMGKQYRKKVYPPTFGLSTTITRVISYQTYPVKSVLETFEIVKEMRKNISKVTQPCLVMQSTHDHIVDKESLEMIYQKINSKIKKKQYIKKAYHTFISDIKNEHVFQDILNFLEEN